MKGLKLQEHINLIVKEVGPKNPLNIKKFYIGKKHLKEAAILYIDNFVDQSIINRDILNPLMLQLDEDTLPHNNKIDFISKKYIMTADTYIETLQDKVAEEISNGKTAIIFDGHNESILATTTGWTTRDLSEPPNEAAVKASREGFTEDLNTNIALIRRNIKDRNLSIEHFIVGKRSKTRLAIAYIDDIVDINVLNEVKRRITAVDVGSEFDGGIFMQYIEDSPYSPFPQIYGTQRPDHATANILEGRIAIILDRSPTVLTAPSIFPEFLQATDDYNTRTINASFVRILRYITLPIIITLPSLYLTLISYNVELLPIKLVTPIIESRQGIYLTPFLEILAMEFIIELLREGGLRLPPKVAQTMSIVGGIIIGNTAIESKIVSPPTLLVVGVTTVATFLLQNYEMSLSIRFLRFPMLVLSRSMGFLGISIGWFFIIIHLMSLTSINVEYFTLSNKDLKDELIRVPMWKMNERPKTLPNNDKIRQKDFRFKFKRKSNE